MMDYRFVTPEIVIQTVVVCFLLALAIALCVWTIRRDALRPRQKQGELQAQGERKERKPSIDSRLPRITTPLISREQWKRMMMR